jgi:hypothetical protein
VAGRGVGKFPGGKLNQGFFARNHQCLMHKNLWFCQWAFKSFFPPLPGLDDAAGGAGSCGTLCSASGQLLCFSGHDTV